MKAVRPTLLLLLAISPLLTVADDHLQLDQTTVIDNHELPKITYIVPWQAAPLPEAERPPLGSLIDDALAPLDRDVMRSRIRYYYAVTPPPAAASGASAGKKDR